MSTFYNFLRKHWIKVSIIALGILVVLAWALPGRWLEIANGVVLIYTLLALLAYTDVTHEMLQLQKEQFERENRPWVHAESVIYKRDQPVKLFIWLINSGKTPASCKAFVGNVFVTSAERKEPIDLPVILGQPIAEVSVFPFISGVRTTYEVPLTLAPSQNDFLTKVSSISFSLKLECRSVTGETDKWPYSFSAEFSIPKFNPQAFEQEVKVTSVIMT